MTDPTHRAMLSHYLLDGATAWPVDSDGVVHLLGDGTWRPESDPEPIRDVRWVLNNQSEELTLARPSTTHSGEWCEAIVVHDGAGYRRVYRTISDPDDIDVLDNDFGARDNRFSSDPETYIRSFPAGTWRDWVTHEPITDHSNFTFDGWRPTGVGIWTLSTGRSHTNGGTEIWTPYNGMIFFSRTGSEHLVWAPFFTYSLDPVTGAYTPKQVRWGRRDTSAWGANPPWSASDVGDYLVEDGVEDDPTWVVPGLPSGDHYYPVKQYWAGTRVVFRRHIEVSSGSTLYTGTWGDFLQVTQAPGEAEVVRRYENGTEEPEGTLGTLVTTFTSRAATSAYRSGEVPVSNANLTPFVHNGFIYPASTMPAIAGNGAWLNHQEADGGPYPHLALINSIPGSDATYTWTVASYLRAAPDALYAGVGIIESPGGGAPNPLYQDEYPLRPPGIIWPPALAQELACGDRPAPDGWDWNAAYNAWVRTTATTFRHTALVADDDSPHDPRVNTATSAVEAWLALGDGLCYEGELGSIPRPRSGATGVLLGREIVGDTDFALDVVRASDDTLMAVMLTADRVTAWTSEGLVWDDELYASIPLPTLVLLTEEPPSLDLRFLHPDWPTPTGVLTVGGLSLVLTPRGREHTRYRWELPDRSVSPPFILHPGWSSELRFPYPNPRAQLTIETDGGGPVN